MIFLNIIWPVFALVLLTFGVWFTLFVQRVAHMKRVPATRDDLATGAAARRYFEPAEMPSNNLVNLFEMPVVFYALVPLLIIGSPHPGVPAAQVVLAWLFVLLRAAHSFIHIGPKKVPQRFMIYAASCAVLLAMWIGFAIDTVAAAHRYHAALETIAAQP